MKGSKASLFLVLMAILALTGFSMYSRLSGDGEGITVGVITALQLLVLAWLSSLKLRP